MTSPGRLTELRDTLTRSVERNVFDVFDSDILEWDYFSDPFLDRLDRFEMHFRSVSFSARFLSVSFFDGDLYPPRPSLTESDINKYTDTFDFPEFKQGYCAIDQEEIQRGDSCRRIKQVAKREGCMPTGCERAQRASFHYSIRLKISPCASGPQCCNSLGAGSAGTSSTPAASHGGCASIPPARSAKPTLCLPASEPRRPASLHSEASCRPGSHPRSMGALWPRRIGVGSFPADPS
jgi:hypothetical protein